MAIRKRVRAEEIVDPVREEVEELTPEYLRETDTDVQGLLANLKSGVEQQLQALGFAYYRFAGLEKLARELDCGIAEKQAIIREREELSRKAMEAEAECAGLRLRLASLHAETAAVAKSIDETNTVLQSLKATLQDSQKQVAQAQQTLAAAPAQVYAFIGQVNTEQGQPAALAGYRVIDRFTQELLHSGMAGLSGEINFQLDRQTALLVLDRDPSEPLIVAGDPVPAAHDSASLHA